MLGGLALRWSPGLLVLGVRKAPLLGPRPERTGWPWRGTGNSAIGAQRDMVLRRLEERQALDERRRAFGAF